jgi:hypothetical protein
LRRTRRSEWTTSRRASRPASDYRICLDAALQASSPVAFQAQSSGQVPSNLRRRRDRDARDPSVRVGTALSIRGVSRWSQPCAPPAHPWLRRPLKTVLSMPGACSLPSRSGASADPTPGAGLRQPDGAPCSAKDDLIPFCQASPATLAGWTRCRFRLAAALPLVPQCLSRSGLRARRMRAFSPNVVGVGRCVLRMVLHVANRAPTITRNSSSPGG